MTCGILIIFYNWGEEWINPFKIMTRRIVIYKDIPSHIHLFAFTSGTRKEEGNHNNKEKKTLLIIQKLITTTPKFHIINLFKRIR